MAKLHIAIGVAFESNDGVTVCLRVACTSDSWEEREDLPKPNRYGSGTMHAVLR